MNRATSIITGASASRHVISACLDRIYQDAGFETALTCGNLDAPGSMPAGSHRAEPRTARRNAARPQLVGRDMQP